jgi:hypothetical protein
MKIEKCERDELNRVWAFEGDIKVLLTEEFIVAHKPQVGDDIEIDIPESIPEVI